MNFLSYPKESSLFHIYKDKNGFIDPAIIRSIFIQHQIFSAYQFHLLSFLNTDQGRYFLQKKTGSKFPNEIIFINRNAIIQKIEKDRVRGTFYSGQPFMNIFLPLIQRGAIFQIKYNPYGNIVDAFAFYAGLKNGKFPRIYEEELLHGFNPLMYRQLLTMPQARWDNQVFNPAVGANSPVNGQVGCPDANNDTWANTRGHAGGQSTVDNSAQDSMRLSTTGTNPNFGSLKRGVFLFDTSTLGAGATISAAIFSLYVTAKTDNLSQSVGITSSNPAANNNLVNSDYAVANFGSTRFATDKTIASISTAAYADWTLNADGRNNISLTGISKFSDRGSSDIDNSAPTWASSVTAQITVDTAGGTNKPKLDVTWTPAPKARTYQKNQAVNRSNTY